MSSLLLNDDPFEPISTSSFPSGWVNILITKLIKTKVTIKIKNNYDVHFLRKVKQALNWN